MNCKIIVPQDLPQSASDLCVIIGNLLDNSIEAVKEIKSKKIIDIILKYEHKRSYINVKNAYEGQRIKNKEGKFVSSKSDKRSHGVGLKSIKRIVEKNEGVLIINTDNNIFDVTVII